jgi:hypothetical protein
VRATEEQDGMSHPHCQHHVPRESTRVTGWSLFVQVTSSHHAHVTPLHFTHVTLIHTFRRSHHLLRGAGISIFLHLHSISRPT